MIMNKEISILFYVISFMASSFIFKFSYKSKYPNFFRWVAILIPLLIAGCRKNVGTDYIAYVNAFYLPMKYNSIFMIFSKEYGFLILAKIAAILNNYKIMFFLSELIILAVLKKIIDESFIKEKYFIYLLYLYIFYLESLNIGRQHIALVFYLYSIRDVFKKNLFKYTLTLFLGSLFHTSILLVYPMYFIYNFLLLGEKYKRVKKVILFGIQIFLLIFVLYYKELIVLGIQFFPKFKHYFPYSEGKIGGSENLIVWMKLLFVFSILIVKKRLIKINDKNKFFIYGILIDLIITFIGFYQIHLKRLSLYFFINYIFLFPQLIEIIKEKWVIRMIILVIAISFCILNFYILGHSEVIPYQI